MGFEALVQITLERGDASTVASFEAAVVQLRQIRHAERLFGDPDYPLRVAARDLDGLAILRDQKLATLPGVHRLTSTIVMKRILDNRPVPLTTRGGQERATAAAPAITSDPKNTHRHDRASRSRDATRSHINQIRTTPEHRSI
jgi:Lrp/AsnC ligand binding domain